MQQMMTDWMNLVLGYRESLDALSQSASTTLLSALWQGAVIAAGLSVCIRLAPRMTATHRFAVWAAGFATLTLLPMAGHWTGAKTSPNTLNFGPEVQKSLLLIDARWSLAIAALWLAASLYRAADLAHHSLSLRRLWKSARPVAMDFGYAGSLKLAGRKTIELCSTDDLERPSVIGFFSPRILVPAWLLERLTPGELDQIVLHEVEHLRRGDDWTNLLQKLCLVLFPLNPGLLWIERRLCREREMACDEAVVRITNAPRAYAACLASLAERSLDHRMQTVSAGGALSLGAWQRRPELARRVHSILLRKRFLGPLGARGLVAVMSCGLVLGSIELARCPLLVAFAQPDAAARLATGQIPHPAFRGSNLAAVPAGRAYLTQLKAVMPEPAVPNAPKHRLAHPAQSSALASAYPAIQVPMPPEDSENWVVLTTWERIDTAPTATQTDYAQAETADGSQRPDQPALRSQRRVEVTRLIFRVLPSDSAESKANPVPPPPMMPRVLFRGGWIVFQL